MDAAESTTLEPEPKPAEVAEPESKHDEPRGPVSPCSPAPAEVLTPATALAHEFESMILKSGSKREAMTMDPNETEKTFITPLTKRRLDKEMVWVCLGPKIQRHMFKDFSKNLYNSLSSSKNVIPGSIQSL